MMWIAEYLAALACGLIGVYKLREGLLILQDYFDQKRALKEVSENDL